MNQNATLLPEASARRLIGALAKEPGGFDDVFEVSRHRFDRAAAMMTATGLIGATSCLLIGGWLALTCCLALIGATAVAAVRLIASWEKQSACFTRAEIASHLHHRSGTRPTDARRAA